MLNSILFANRSLTLDSDLLLEEAKGRLLLLSERPTDVETPYLSVSLKGNTVFAGYEVPFTYNLGAYHGPVSFMRLLQAFRPSFRGQLVSLDDTTRLNGRFGINDLGRALAVAFIIALLTIVLSRSVNIPHQLEIAAWLTVVLFVLALFLTRLNSDDIPYIAKNLLHAMQSRDPR